MTIETPLAAQRLQKRLERIQGALRKLQYAVTYINDLSFLILELDITATLLNFDEFISTTKTQESFSLLKEVCINVVASA